MRIKVQAEGRHIYVPIPSWLLFNSLSAYLCHRFAASHINAVSGLTYEQLRVLFHMLKRSRKKLNGTPLVDVESGNGDKVQVYL